jgi:hypothetical protein
MIWRWIDDTKVWAETFVDDVSYTCPKDREPLLSWLEEGNEPTEWTGN